MWCLLTRHTNKLTQMHISCLSLSLQLLSPVSGSGINSYGRGMGMRLTFEWEPSPQSLSSREGD